MWSEIFVVWWIGKSIKMASRLPFAQKPGCAISCSGLWISETIVIKETTKCDLQCPVSQIALPEEGDTFYMPVVFGEVLLTAHCFV